MFTERLTAVVEDLTGAVIDAYGKANDRGDLATPPAIFAGIHESVLETYEARKSSQVADAPTLDEAFEHLDAARSAFERAAGRV